MLFYRGVQYLTKKKQPIPSRPNLQNLKQVQQYLKSANEALKKPQWPQNLDTVLWILIEISQLYPQQTTAYLYLGWGAVFKQARNTVFFENILYITQTLISTDSSKFQTFQFIVLVWESLDHQNAMIKHGILRILGLLPQKLAEFLLQDQSRVILLLNHLKERNQFVRNGNSHSEAIIVFHTIPLNEELSKIMGLNGAFQQLLQISVEEQGVVLKDCLVLMKNLLTDFNKDLIRKIPKISQQLKLLSQKSGEQLMEFLVEFCQLKNRNKIQENLSIVRPLIENCFKLAFPMTGLSQSPNAVDLLVLVLESGKELIRVQLEDRPLIDALLVYSVVGNQSKKTNQLLSMLIKDQDFQSTAASRIIFMPFSYQFSIPSFNSLLNQLLATQNSLSLITKTLEILLWRNQISKELFLNLKVDTEQETLFGRLVSLFIYYIKSSDHILTLSRLFCVFLHQNEIGSQKLYQSLNTYLFELSEFIKTPGYSSSLCSCMIGLISVYSKQPQLTDLILNRIGYTDFCSSIEHILNKKHFRAREQSGDLLLEDQVLSFCMIKDYRNYVQIIKKHLIAKIVKNAPQEQNQLAKLVQAQDMLINNFQSIRNFKADDSNVKELQSQIRRLQQDLGNLEVENNGLKAKLVQQKVLASRQYRASVVAYANLQEKLDKLEMENLWIQKGKVKVVGTSEDYWKLVVEKLNRENKELCQLVGEQKSQIEKVKVKIEQKEQEEIREKKKRCLAIEIVQQVQISSLQRFKQKEIRKFQTDLQLERLESLGIYIKTISKQDQKIQVQKHTNFLTQTVQTDLVIQPSIHQNYIKQTSQKSNQISPFSHPIQTIPQTVLSFQQNNTQISTTTSFLSPFSHNTKEDSKQHKQGLKITAIQPYPKISSEISSLFQSKPEQNLQLEKAPIKASEKMRDIFYSPPNDKKAASISEFFQAAIPENPFSQNSPPQYKFFDQQPQNFRNIPLDDPSPLSTGQSTQISSLFQPVAQTSQNPDNQVSSLFDSDPAPTFFTRFFKPFQQQMALLEKINKFAEIPDLYQNLDQSGYITKLSTIFQEISQESFMTALILPNFKVIVQVLLDASMRTNQGMPLRKRHPNSQKKLIPSNTYQKTSLSMLSSNFQNDSSLGQSCSFVGTQIKPSSVRNIKRSYQSLKKQRKEEQWISPPREKLDLFSDFSRNKRSFTFSKEPRRLVEINTVSPGPAAYKYKPNQLRLRSPCAIMPKAQSKQEFPNWRIAGSSN